MFVEKKYLDYVPLVLITLFFIAEEELEHHVFHSCLQLVFSFFLVLAFLIGVKHLSCDRKTVLLFLIVLWVILVYAKQKYVINLKKI